MLMCDARILRVTEGSSEIRHHHCTLRIGQRRSGTGSCWCNPLHGQTPACRCTGKFSPRLNRTILSGRWPRFGYRIPSEMELTVRYQCSRAHDGRQVLNKLASRSAGAQTQGGSLATRPQTESSAVLDSRSPPGWYWAWSREYSSRAVAAASATARARTWRAIRWPGHLIVQRAVPCRWRDRPRPFCIRDRLINLESRAVARHRPFTEHSPSSWMVSHVPMGSANTRIQCRSGQREPHKACWRSNPAFPAW